MKGNLLFLVACILFGIGLWLVWARRIASEEQKIAVLNSQVAEMRGKYEKALEELTQAKYNLKSKRANSDAKVQAAQEPQDSPFLSSIKADVQVSARFYEKLKQSPGAMIPELDLLTATDWVTLGQQLKFLSNLERTDVLVNPTRDVARLAASEIRHRAKERFIDSVKEAISAWEGANKGGRLYNMGQLRPFLDRSITEPMLARYEVIEQGWRDTLTEERGFNPDIKSADLVVVEKVLPFEALEGPAYFYSKDGGLNSSAGSRISITPKIP